MKKLKVILELYDSGDKIFAVDPVTKKPCVSNWQKGARSRRDRIKLAVLWGFCPHLHGYVILDIDYHPDYPDKASFRNEGRDECQLMLLELKTRLSTLIPNFNNKLVHWNFSGSGYGMHLYFKTPVQPYNQDKHDEWIKRKKHALGWCDVFDGGGQCIIHDPVGFKASNKFYGVKDDILDADIQTILNLRPSVKSTVRKSKPKSTVNPLVKDICFIKAIQNIVGANSMHIPLSDKTFLSRSGRPITWTPYEIGAILNRIHISNWQSREFRIIAGMAIHDIGTSPLLFQIFSGILLALGYTELKPERKWIGFKRKQGEKDNTRISMAKLTAYAGYRNWDCAENWFRLRVRHCEGSSTRIEDFYADYLKFNPGGHERKAFTQYFNKKLSVQKKGTESRRGNRVVGYYRESHFSIEIPVIKPSGRYKYFNLEIKGN